VERSAKAKAICLPVADVAVARCRSRSGTMVEVNENPTHGLNGAARTMDSAECGRCGQVHKKCNGHNGEGQPCQAWPIKGGTVCVCHGGKARQVRHAANRNLAQAEFRRYLREQGIPEITDPTQRLIDLLGEADAFYAFMRDKLGSIDVDEWESFDDKGGSQARVYVELFERAQERLQRFLVDIQRLGLEERMVHLSERQADMVCTVIERVLIALGLPDSVYRQARDEVPRQLALVAGEAAA
jgi:hypothetical protein